MIAIQSVDFRTAGPLDADRIAALHADSWRRHYRGAYSDTFLDGDVHVDRRAVWHERLEDPSAECCTIVAEDTGRLVGFVHTFLREDATWGSFLDNLHVAHTHMRHRIGSRLLALTAKAVQERLPGSGLYLWVLEENLTAQGFYQNRGGTCVERDHAQPPGGDVTRLKGSPVKLRYFWPDITELLDTSSDVMP